MGSSSKKPGIKDISDLKARLGLTKQKEDGEAPAGTPAPAATTPAAAPSSPPAGVPAGIPAGIPSPAPSPMAPAPSPFAQPASPFAAPQAQAPAASPAPAAAPPPEDDSYDYEPPPVPETPDFDPNQYDPAIKQPISPMRIVAIAVILLVISGGAFFAGWAINAIATDRVSVNRRINMAQDVLKRVEPKVEGFEAFVKPMKERADAGINPLKFDERIFEHLAKFASFGFALDPSSDVPSEAIILGQKASANPLGEIRAFAAGTMLLTQLLSAHVAETRADMEEITRLQDVAGEGGELFGVRFAPDLYLGYIQQGTRTQYGVEAAGIYKIKRPILDEEEAERIWKQMKVDLNIPDEPPPPADPKKKGAAEEEPQRDLPPKLIYEVQARGFAPTFVLADEFILVRRGDLLGSSANAVERYERRMKQILEIIFETEKTTEMLLKKLQEQANETPL